MASGSYTRKFKRDQVETTKRSNKNLSEANPKLAHTGNEPLLYKSVNNSMARKRQPFLREMIVSTLFVIIIGSLCLQVIWLSSQPSTPELKSFVGGTIYEVSGPTNTSIETTNKPSPNLETDPKSFSLGSWFSNTYHQSLIYVTNLNNISLLANVASIIQGLAIIISAIWGILKLFKKKRA